MTLKACRAECNSRCASTPDRADVVEPDSKPSFWLRLKSFLIHTLSAFDHAGLSSLPKERRVGPECQNPGGPAG